MLVSCPLGLQNSWGIFLRKWILEFSWFWLPLEVIGNQKNIPSVSSFYWDRFPGSVLLTVFEVFDSSALL